MKYITKHLIIGFCLFSLNALSQDGSDQIVGFWDTGEAMVEIYKMGDRYIGNPIDEEGERNEKIEILNLEYKSGKWKGEIFSVKRKKRMDVTCKIEGEILNSEVKAGFATRELQWTKSSR